MHSILQRVSTVHRQQALARGLQTQSAYVPVAAQQHIDQRAPKSRLKPKPEGTYFYTGRPGTNDAFAQIEDATHHAKSALRALSLLPLPEFARKALPPRSPVWKNRVEMSGSFSGRLSQAKYRRALVALNRLDEYRNIAQTAQVPQLADGIEDVLSLFEKENKEAVLARGYRKPVKFDEYGRTYTVGRRKTSSARVWMIPVKGVKLPAADSAPLNEPLPNILDMERTPETVNYTSQEPISTTTILVNNLPLATYFPLLADREKIVRPFKVTGLLGAFNVFALVRGGGTTGQSGAVMHGIAKALSAHVPAVSLILRRCTYFVRCIERLLNRSRQPNLSAAILVWSRGKRPASPRLASGSV
jgi:small subunit ribosomal protein S9